MRIWGTDLSARKQYWGGTHRTRSPADTLAAWMPLMGRLGVTRLANITGLDHVGIPVYVAIRPNSRSLAVSQGKGIDPDAAKASALLETIEGWHAENITLPLRHERYAALARSANVVDIERLPLVEAAFDRTSPFFWTEGWDLLAGEPCWVPFDAVTADFVIQRGRQPAFLMSSNGLASGNHLLEATVHALTEVMERDALFGWKTRSYAERAPYGLDLETVDDPHCRELLRRVAAGGLRAHAWQLPSRFGVPVFFATIDDDHARVRELASVAGSGCHLCAGVALSRALSEAAQTRLTVISGARDDLPSVSARVEPSPPPRPPPGTLRFSAAQDRATDSFDGDVATLVSALRAAGLERAVVVDLSRRDVGIPVVKVVVPGLAFDAGLSYRARLEGARAPEQGARS